MTPSTGCPPEGFGPAPQKPATPSAPVGCAPSACAETPWTPEDSVKQVDLVVLVMYLVVSDLHHKIGPFTVVWFR